MPNIKEAITRPLGPLPVWGWGLAIGGGYIGYRILTGKGAFGGSSGDTSAAVGSSGTTPDSGGGSSGDATGTGTVTDTSGIFQQILDALGGIQDTITNNTPGGSNGGDGTSGGGGTGNGTGNGTGPDPNGPGGIMNPPYGIPGIPGGLPRPGPSPTPVGTVADIITKRVATIKSKTGIYDSSGKIVKYLTFGTLDLNPARTRNIGGTIFYGILDKNGNPSGQYVRKGSTGYTIHETTGPDPSLTNHITGAASVINPPSTQPPIPASVPSDTPTVRMGIATPPVLSSASTIVNHATTTVVRP